VSSVAIVGATGAVGREMLAVLRQRGYPLSKLRLLASGRSAGSTVHAMGRDLRVEEATAASFRGVDLALFSAGASVSRVLAPAAREAGALVVDNSSAFRMDPDCPLVVPEINGHALASHGGIIANPNCSTILLCMALEPIRAVAGLSRIVVCSYQAVSGAGARALEEMRAQEEAEREGRELRHEIFPAVIAHNVIPFVQAIGDDGYSTEETKVRDETRRIFGMPDLPVSATCVRVPVTRAHSEAVHAGTLRPLTPEQARQAYEGRPGLVAWREGFPTPRQAAGGDEVHVGRIRADRVFEPGLALWCVMDQLRKGAALNAVQIAERALGIAAGT